MSKQLLGLYWCLALGSSLDLGCWRLDVLPSIDVLPRSKRGNFRLRFHRRRRCLQRRRFRARGSNVPPISQTAARLWNTSEPWTGGVAAWQNRLRSPGLGAGALVGAF